jgi:hypothetical protein
MHQLVATEWEAGVEFFSASSDGAREESGGRTHEYLNIEVYY